MFLGALIVVLEDRECLSSPILQTAAATMKPEYEEYIFLWLYPGAGKTVQFRTIAECGAASRQSEWTSIIMHHSAFKEITVSALTCS